MFSESVFPNILPLKTEKTVPKMAQRTPKKIPSLNLNSVLKIRRMHATITIPIINSLISTFRLNTIGSKIDANKVDKDKQLNAIETLETLME